MGTLKHSFFQGAVHFLIKTLDFWSSEIAAQSKGGPFDFFNVLGCFLIKIKCKIKQNHVFWKSLFGDYVRHLIFYSSSLVQEQTLKRTILVCAILRPQVETKFWVTISFERFVDRYDEFGNDSFTKSYQKSEIFLMVKFENVWRMFGRLNDAKTFGPRHTNLATRTQNFDAWK